MLRNGPLTSMLARESTADQRPPRSGVKERRRWRRVRVNWTIVLYRQDATPPIYGTIENMSSGGVSFSAPGRFAPGEHVCAEISIPANTLGYNGFALPLDCRIDILRVERRDSGCFLVGGRFGDYTVQWPQPAETPAGL